MQINNKEICFKSKIFGVEIAETKIFIILEPQMNKRLSYDERNSIYCYDYDGNFLWQIKPPLFPEFSNVEDNFYTGIYYDSKNDKFYANNFDGVRFEICQNTGIPISYKRYR